MYVQPMLERSPSKSFGNSFKVLMALVMPHPSPGMKDDDVEKQGRNWQIRRSNGNIIISLIYFESIILKYNGHPANYNANSNFQPYLGIEKRVGNNYRQIS